MLRPSDLSLESVVSLADLPIPGFPKSSEAANDSQQDDLKGQENARVPARVEGGGDGGGEDAAGDGVVEFADTEAGAFVLECSSNAETSGGVLQARKIDCLFRRLFHSSVLVFWTLIVSSVSFW